MADTMTGAPSLRAVILPDVTALLREGNAIRPYAFASHLARPDGPLAQAIAAARVEGPPWFSPESGPRDPTPVILAVRARSDGRIVVGEGHFDPEDGDGKWWWAGESRGDYGADAIETHFGIVVAWMPLPPPPTTAQPDTASPAEGGRTDG